MQLVDVLYERTGVENKLHSFDFSSYINTNIYNINNKTSFVLKSLETKLRGAYICVQYESFMYEPLHGQ